MITVILIYAIFKKVNAYNAFIQGVTDSLKLITSIFPSMMAMILLVNLLKEVQIFEFLTSLLSPALNILPSEILAMCFFRPISGGASMAMLIHILNTFGPDSLFGVMASVIQGSTDTTIYVIALYFSSIGIKKIRNALWIGLFADLIGIMTAIFLTVHFF